MRNSKKTDGGKYLYDWESGEQIPNSGERTAATSPPDSKTDRNRVFPKKLGFSSRFALSFNINLLVQGFAVSFPISVSCLLHIRNCQTFPERLFLTIFLGRTDIICQYALNLASMLRLLVGILYYEGVCIIFRGGIC